MARARSPEKRQALLDAAVRAIADDGLGASTSKIAKGAGVAEGTLFTYFATKDELLNVLYLELKTEACRRMLSEFPQSASLKERTRHVWNEYLRWAMERPAERSVSVVLGLSPIVTASTREQLPIQFPLLRTTMNEVGERGAFALLPKGFASSAMAAMQEAVLDTVTKKPRDRDRLIYLAFDAFWRMTK